MQDIVKSLQPQLWETSFQFLFQVVKQTIQADTLFPQSCLFLSRTSCLLWNTISLAHHFLTTSDCKFLILNQVDTNIIGLHPFDDPDDGDDDDPVDNSPFWWWLMSGVSWEELPNRSGRSNIVSDLHCSSLLQWLLSNHNNVDNTIRITGYSWNILRQLLEYVDCGSNCGQLPCCHTVHCTVHCTLYTPGFNCSNE